MSNPEKPVHIPNYHREDKDINKAPEFNHNIMGSSAGAGSGEFHLYRKMRRKEMERQQVLQFRKHRDDANDAFQEKIKDNEEEADERTAKKRAKRQKTKQKKKQMKKKGAQKKESESEESSEEDEEEKTEEAVAPKPKAEPLVIKF
jgi:hypothetical protein